MNPEVFDQQVDALHQRLLALQRQMSAALPSPLMSREEVIEDLATALEELHVAQEELRQQNEELVATRQVVETERQRYQELFTFAPDGYLVTDAQGSIREANSVAATLLSMHQDFLVGKPLSVFVAEENRAALYTRLIQLQEGSLPMQEWEVYMQPRRVAPFPAALTVAPVCDSHGKVTALHWLLRNITVRKRVENELRDVRNGLERRVRERTTELRTTNEALQAEIIERQQIEEELRQAKEAAEVANRAKSEFLATMSHELRTPLHIIIGYTDLLMENDFGGLTKEELDILARVRRSATELVDLVTAVLDISRLEAGRLPVESKEVEIPALLEELHTELQGLQERSCLDFVWQVEPHLPTIRTDPGKLKMVLKNLIGNSVKFTEKGSITVAAHSCEGGIEISVADTGIGISPEEMSEIFQPFQQGEQSKGKVSEGAGLGLHIVKRMLTLLGGKIEVASEVGRGSTFRVWAPNGHDE
jgi:PAS domain S-box-containing protein